MQQINLYLPELQPKKEVLSLPQVGLITAAFLFIFIAFGWSITSDTAALKQQLTSETEMLKPLELQKQELDKMVAGRPDESALAEEIAALEYHIQNKSLALNTLKNSDVAASDGFSQLLEELAQSKNSKLWFTDIGINNDVVLLKGQTLDPKLITAWIENATNGNALSRQFSAIKIEQHSTYKRVYDFELSGGVVVHHE